MIFKKIFKILIAVILLIVVAALMIIKLNPGCELKECVNINGIENWTLVNTEIDSGGYWSGLYNSDGYRIKVDKFEDTSVESAAEMTRLATNNILQVFDTVGVESDTQVSRFVCPDEFMPKGFEMTTESGLKINFISSNMDPELKYADCTAKELPFKAYSAMFHCSKSTTWFNIEFIVENNSQFNQQYFTDMLKSLRCL